MQRIAVIIAEVVLLFSALFFTLAPIPSNDVERLPLFPAAAIAVALFAVSRLLRWQRNFAIAGTETAAFALFVWGSNAVANALYVH